MSPGKLRKVIDDFHFTGHEPLSEDFVTSLKTKPKILERRTIIARVTAKVLQLIKIFEDDIGDV